MEGIKIQLNDILSCRERRAQIQTDYIHNYHCPVISFCMNIPGPVKTNQHIRKAFEIGKRELMSWLHSEQIRISGCTEFHEDTGDELIMAVNCPAEKLKEKAVLIEETPPLGRLYDIDIIDKTGTKLSRKFRRKCIICGKDAYECARARTHSVDELQTKVEEIIQKFL